MFSRKFVRDGLIILAIPLVSASSLHDGRATTSDSRAALADSGQVTRLANYAPLIPGPENHNARGPAEKSGQTDPDKSPAEKTFSEAEELLKEERAESSRRAIEKFK